MAATLQGSPEACSALLRDAPRFDDSFGQPPVLRGGQGKHRQLAGSGPGTSPASCLPRSIVL